MYWEVYYLHYSMLFILSHKLERIFFCIFLLLSNRPWIVLETKNYYFFSLSSHFLAPFRSKDIFIISNWFTVQRATVVWHNNFQLIQFNFTISFFFCRVNKLLSIYLNYLYAQMRGTRLELTVEFKERRKINAWKFFHNFSLSSIASN